MSGLESQLHLHHHQTKLAGGSSSGHHYIGDTTTAAAILARGRASAAAAANRPAVPLPTATGQALVRVSAANDRHVILSRALTSSLSAATVNNTPAISAGGVMAFASNITGPQSKILTAVDSQHHTSLTAAPSQQQQQAARYQELLSQRQAVGLNHARLTAGSTSDFASVAVQQPARPNSVQPTGYRLAAGGGSAGGGGGSVLVQTLPRSQPIPYQQSTQQQTHQEFTHQECRSLPVISLNYLYRYRYV